MTLADDVLKEINEETLKERVKKIAEEKDISIEAAYLVATGDDIAGKVALDMDKQIKSAQKNQSEQDIEEVAALKKEYKDIMESGGPTPNKMTRASQIKRYLLEKHNVQV